MILTPRSAFIRNILVSGTNGAVTLVILLIAPLGLAAVLINTVLVVIATFITAQTADQIIRFLQGDSRANTFQVLPDEQSGQIKRR